MWKKKGGDPASASSPDGSYKYGYKDRGAVNGPVGKIKVVISEKKGLVQLGFVAKKFDLGASPDAAVGTVGMSVGARCFMETTPNCKQKPGKLVCKAPK